jgi:hypothetical protein
MTQNAGSSLRLHSFDLADQDREAIKRIRERLEINSNALAVRLAIRSLANRLNDPNRYGNPENGAVAKEERINENA